MHRSTANYAVDVLTFLVILLMIWTGTILYFVLPPGSGSGQGARELLGWTRHDWGDLHFYLAAGLVGLIVVHVALHWSWVCMLTRRIVTRRAPDHALSAFRRNIYGIAFIAAVTALLSGATWLSYRGVQTRGAEFRGARAGAGHADDRRAAPGGHERGGGPAQAADAGRSPGIGGATTLAEAAASAGISVEELAGALGLPRGVDAGRRLGRLRQEYGFRMSDVRRAIERLRADARANESGSNAGEKPS